MGLSIGGATIKSLELTKSHGVTPASANIVALGAGVFAADSPVILNIGSFVFNGIITDCREETGDGKSLKVTVADNRILLQDDSVFGEFNEVEVIEDDLSTPGIDRKKRYWHIYPADWATQKKTYTDAPHTAREICQKLLAAPTLQHAWAADYTNEFETVVYAVNAQSGKKLGTLLQEICDDIGVQMTLVSETELGFSVKGIGSAPGPSFGNSTDISDGFARGSSPTQVRVVGDRNLYQELNIELEADWSDHFEQFWFKATWVQHVIDWFGLSSDPADRGEAEARARSVTLREYIAQTGRTDVADYGTWGEVSRMEIPVWIYIDDIVFKAYRVPDTFRLNGLDITSLELRDGLLSAVEGDPDGTLTYKTLETYPDAKAFFIIQGQPLSLYDPKTKQGITPAQFARMRTLWQSNNRFNLDSKNKSVIFEEPVFTDDPSAPLFIQPNKDKSGLTDELTNLVVPNANAQIKAARVRGSICFEAEKFYADFGGGNRRESKYVSGLNRHNLLTNGTLYLDLGFADDQTVDEKAAAIGAAMLLSPAYILSGGFTRWGAAGMELNGSIDRVTVRLSFESGDEKEGISEHVEYSKERPPSHFESRLELTRRLSSRDLFPGQKALQESARQERLIGQLKKDKKRQSDRPFENLDAITSRLPGNRDCGASQVYVNGQSAMLVGTPIFIGANSQVDLTKAAFAGVVTIDGSLTLANTAVPVASQGVVPTRVQGPVSSGDSVGCEDNSDFAKADGRKFVGIAQVDYQGNDTVLLPVRLGGGAGSNAPETPFQVVQVAPTDPHAKPLIGVISNSHLSNSEDKDTHEEDNSDWGLLDDDQTPSTAFAIPAIGAKIWLEIELNKDQSIKSIDVRHDKVKTDDGWTNYPDPIEINTDDPSNPYQQFFHAIIAEVTDPEQDPRPGLIIDVGTKSAPDKRQITQLLFTNLMMTTAVTTADADQPGLPLIVPIPWNFPGTKIDGSADELNNVSPALTPWSFSGAVAATHHAWETTFANEGTSDAPNYKIRVRPGSMNSLIPSNIFDGFAVGGAGLFYVKLRCDTDGRTPNAITVLANSTPIDPAVVVAQNTPPPTFFDVLALVAVTDNSGGGLSAKVYQVRFSNLSATPVIDTLVSVTATDPGQEPFVRWWKWQITE